MTNYQDTIKKIKELADYYTNIDFPNLAAILREAENALKELTAEREIDKK